MVIGVEEFGGALDGHRPVRRGELNLSASIYINHRMKEYCWDVIHRIGDEVANDLLDSIHVHLQVCILLCGSVRNTGHSRALLDVPIHD